MNQPQVVLDYETRSEAELKKVGGIEYAKHDSTEIVCAGYKINKEPAKIWLPWRDPPPQELIRAARHNYIWIAHNAPFEQAITKFVLQKRFKKFPDLAHDRWKCTAAKAATCALPRNLEGALAALNLSVQKDMVGNRLMKKYMKPRRAWLTWKKKYGGRARFLEPDKYFDDEDELEAIYKYCLTDVEGEYLLDRALPDLIPHERKIWLLNQKMNFRGVQIDTGTAQKVIGLIKIQTDKLQKEVFKITGGAIKTVGQRDKILEWLEDEGLSIPNLAAKTIEETLNSIHEVGLQGSRSERLLQIRQTLAKSSTKKYQAMLTRAGRDGRVRDLAMYHGASTGRDSGTGLQLHNLPKGKIKNTNCAIKVVQTEDVEFIEALYGNPMAVYSACIRGMVTATKGFKLFAADYNAIEARVLSWIAEDKKSLNIFKRHLDPYVLRAADIFNIEPDQVTEAQRFVGKIAELALGFQMGAPKFLRTCHDWGAKEVTLEVAEKAVRSFREDRAPVTKLWPRVERAAINAVKSPQLVIKHNRVGWHMSGGFLCCTLPSGRRLRYYGPTVRMEPTPWGELRPKLYHWSVNPKTKKWENAATYGGKLVENIVQGTARDVMFNAALRSEEFHYSYLFSVHDEIVSESKRGSVEEFEKILTTLPGWANGLPVVAKGWSGERYKKG